MPHTETVAMNLQYQLFVRNVYKPLNIHIYTMHTMYTHTYKCIIWQWRCYTINSNLYSAKFWNHRFVAIIDSIYWSFYKCLVNFNLLITCTFNAIVYNVYYNKSYSYITLKKKILSNTSVPFTLLFHSKVAALCIRIINSLSSQVNSAGWLSALKAKPLICIHLLIRHFH